MFLMLIVIYNFFLSVTEPRSPSDSVHGILEDIWNKLTKSQVTGPTCSQNLCSTSTNHTWQFTITIHVTAGKMKGFPYIFKALGLVSSTVTNKQTNKIVELLEAENKRMTTKDLKLGLGRWWSQDTKWQLDRRVSSRALFHKVVIRVNKYCMFECCPSWVSVPLLKEAKADTGAETMEECCLRACSRNSLIFPFYWKPDFCHIVCFNYGWFPLSQFPLPFLSRSIHTLSVSCSKIKSN